MDDSRLGKIFPDIIHPLLSLSCQSPITTPAPHLLAVALSGGADSLALTLLADAYARAHGGRIVALTVDHGLRAESAAEARTVRAWMRTRGIEHQILTPPPDPAASNLQASARQRRYDALAEYCRAQGILHCLVAHHAGDQRETVALHEARGESADGASGIGAMRAYRGVRFLRPLLGVERADIETYLRAQHVAWIEDPSNRNMDFARVRMRQQLADNPAQAIALSATARHAGEARGKRDDALADAAMRLVTLHPAGYAQLPLAGWQQLDARLAHQLLADLLTTVSGATHRPRVAETTGLAAALADGMPTRTLQHCEITCHNGTLRIAREHGRVAPPLTLSGEGCVTWDGRFQVTYHIAKGQALTLKALGHAGRKQGDRSLPLATPSLWHLDVLQFTPHMETSAFEHQATRVVIGFAPAKPLAAAPFWWLNKQ
ncbi:MAG: tRNA lysidine(34) synthetase TilS [Pseudomonadota bacterium]